MDGLPSGFRPNQGCILLRSCTGLVPFHSFYNPSEQCNIDIWLYRGGVHTVDTVPVLNLLRRAH